MAESKSVESKIALLIKKRGTFKSKLTSFCNYIKVVKDCTIDKLSASNISELKTRLEKIEDLYSDFDVLQGQIEELSEDPEVRYQEREAFESQYYDVVGVAKALCEASSVAFPYAASNVAEVSSMDVHNQRHNNFVRLPKIELPSFNGNYQHWLEFRDTFISIIHSNDSIDNINKFHYLRACLQGSAALIIKSLDFKANNYASAWELLCKRYDNKRLLVNNHVQSLFNVNSIQKESSKALRYIVDVTNKNLRALATLDQPTQHWDTLIIYMMSTKLDSVTNREWEEYRNNRSDPPTLEIFLTFLTNRADLLETLEEARNTKGKLENQAVQKPKSFVISNFAPKPKAFSCPLCHKGHQLFTCDSFRKLSIELRIQKAKEFKVCLNCLRFGHNEQNCKLTHCKYCNKKHNTLLHVDLPSETISHESIVLSAEHSGDSTNAHNTLLSTALVKVFDKLGKPHAARILLDNGSTGNFVTQELCTRLCLPTHHTSSKVTGINNQTSNSSQSCSLTLESYNGCYRTDVDCFVLPRITSLLPNSYINVQNLDLPSGICLADPTFNVPSTIDILVGADVFWRVIGTNRIDLGKRKPVLFETRFGWLVSGAIYQPGPKGHVCLFTSSDNNLPSDLSRFWELDSIPTKHELTTNEHACEKSFLDTTYRDQDGRFVVFMPLKESPEELGDSLAMAQRRFFSLERRLDRDPNMKRLYVDFMREYIELGHMTETLSKQPNTTYCFLPHHGVFREHSSTTKLRVVFDASANTSSGKSLNDIQRVGPTVQDDIIAILIRFRQHQYVVSADCEKMYRQIKIDEVQRPLQCILWRFDSSHPLKTYTLNTVTYGTASAPYLATRCLSQLGYDSPDPAVSRAICHDFYVDDYISGGESIESTIELCKGVTTALETAKFRLRKWHSNNEHILSSIGAQYDSVGSVDFGAKEAAKTLGLNWVCSKDILNFSIRLNIPDKITKRAILSAISQVFDPLGLVSPCVVEAKLLMQQLWILKCSWDETVPLNIAKQFIEFSQSLPHLNNLQIPRCIKVKSITNEIHIFTDASEKAYGACVYIRSVASDGTVSVRLLASKSKVAPIKATTIPRLELCAALMGARLCAKVVSSVTFEHSARVYWTDSMIVLGWLSSSGSQLKPFVRHRVTEIQDTSDGWRYVPSKQNPADLVSRGLSAKLIGDTELWWSGPTFLKLDSYHWPDKPNQENKIELPEIVNYHIKIKDIEENSNLLSNLIQKTSNFSKLKRITAFILRFINNISKNNTKLTGFLSVSELKTATTKLLQVAQRESFPVECQLLMENKPLPSKNRLLPLSPFIDPDNLIRVGGRLSNSYYDYDVKHPILICGKHRLSQLIFNFLHLSYMHAGPQLLLATARHNYWPLGGTRLAKRIVHSCVKCSRFKGQTIQPIMGNLPSNRIHLEYPFLESGVDYAGPVLIADRKGRGCKLIKSYICVFVCLATKALHLEFVSDLTKEAYIAALSRFIARRGKPQNMFSDNGTTFIGTFNELSRLLKTPSLSSHLADQGINFSFIPAYTPHFGGLWESAVKSVKHHLRRVLELTHLDFEEMATLLIQIEAILNSRPITPLSNDPLDLSFLSPAHFLIGRSLVALPHPQLVDRRIASLPRFQRIEALKQHFWTRFHKEYVLWLQGKTKWRASKGELKEGALVIVKDATAPPLLWPLGRILRVLPGQDGVARVADIKTRKGVIRRAFNTICPLPTNVEVDTSRRGVWSCYDDNTSPGEPGA